MLDNMESLLPPGRDAARQALYEPKILEDLFALCARLLEAGARLLFTTHEALPEPFAAGGSISLGRLDREEATAL